MNIGQYFLTHDDTFFLMLWTIGLTLLCVYVIVGVRREDHVPHDEVPLLCDAIGDCMALHPHVPIVYTACQRCGQHAVKVKNQITCLDTSCRHKTLHN